MRVRKARNARGGTRNLSTTDSIFRESFYTSAAAKNVARNKSTYKTTGRFILTVMKTARAAIRFYCPGGGGGRRTVWVEMAIRWRGRLVKYTSRPRDLFSAAYVYTHTIRLSFPFYFCLRFHLARQVGYSTITCRLFTRDFRQNAFLLLLFFALAPIRQTIAFTIFFYASIWVRWSSWSS